MVGLTNVRDFLRYRALRARMWYYRAVEDEYADAWERQMQYRVQAHGPDAATGEKPEGAGEQQLDFLQSVGLEPDDRLLDFGCGSLRFGSEAIRYLKPGRYVGADISGAVMSAAAKRLDDAVMGCKDPRLVVNDDCSLEFLADPVDIIWAHSVVTHLPPDDLRELLAAVPEATTGGGCLLASYFPDERPANPKDWGYPPERLESLAAEVGVAVDWVGPDVYRNPHDHSLLAAWPQGDDPAFWPPGDSSQQRSRVVADA
jgi:SAM-dependent methyltransferase